MLCVLAGGYHGRSLNHLNAASEGTQDHAKQYALDASSTSNSHHCLLETLPPELYALSFSGRDPTHKSVYGAALEKAP